MVHQFNIELATKYGIEEAILIENLYFWISKNGANKVHLHEGRYWTYNSRKAFADLFPYINESKIRRVFDLLCNGKIDNDSNEYVIKPILIKGNFNKTDFDKTNWYAFSDYGIEMLKELKYDIKNLCQNEPMDWSKMTNGDAQNDQPIPDNKPDSKHKEERDKSLSKKVGKFNVRHDLSYVDDNYLNTWLMWLDYKDEIRKQYNTKIGANGKYKDLLRYSDNNPLLALCVVRHAIDKGWDGFQQLTDKQKAFFLSKNSPYLNESDIISISANKNEVKELEDGIVNEKGEVWSEQLGKWLK